MHILLNALPAVSGGSITYIRNVAAPLAAMFAEDSRHRLSILVHRTQLAFLGEMPAAGLRVVDGDMPRGYGRLRWEAHNIERYLPDIDVYFLPYQVGKVPADRRSVMMLRNMLPFFHWRYPGELKTRLRNVVLNRMTRRDLSHASKVIAVSAFARDYLLHNIGKDPSSITTIHHGCGEMFRQSVAPDDASRLHALGIDPPYFFTSGSLFAYRRLEDVIAAFARAAPTESLPKLVITGSGAERKYGAKIRRLIAGSDVSGNILDLGSVDAATMALLYRNCFAFVTATEIEACPNTIIEALTSGCAIVVPRIDPMPEFVGDRGLYFTPRDVEGLAAILRRVMAEPPLRADLQAKALSARFSWERCAAETFAFLTVW